MSILARLNALPADLTPDEVVKRITTQGWMRVRDMTEEYFRANVRVKHAICYNYDRSGAFSMAGGSSDGTWTFNHCDPTYINFVSALTRNEDTVYWVIPFSEYKKGVYPSC